MIVSRTGPANFRPAGTRNECFHRHAQRLIAKMEAEEANWTVEDEAELEARMKGKTAVQVPSEIVPAVEALLSRHKPDAETR